MVPRLLRAAVVGSLSLVGCVTPSAAPRWSPPPLTEAAPPPPEPAEWAAWPVVPPVPRAPERPAAVARLVRKARRLVGVSSLKPVAPHLPDDCTGLARTVYETAGLELLTAALRGDNGVTAIYRLALEKRALHAGTPKPGDLVFFRETYDLNRDQLENDGLTHIGVVEAVDDTGLVTFVHRVGPGVQRGRLDPAAPGDRKRNDWLRPARKARAGRLTGELFVVYASADELLAQPLRADVSPAGPREAVAPALLRF